MINVICLKWGNKYGPEYVNRLYRSLMSNIKDVEWKFWCFTDDHQGINPDVTTVSLPYADQLDSWWNKIWLFSEGVPFGPGESIFYIDLDTLVTRDITDMITDSSQRLVALRDFYHGIAKTANSMGSGLMRWRHGDYYNIWQEFIKDPTGAIESIKPYGDQRWIELVIDGDYDTWQDLYPNRVVSFKVDCADGLPNDAAIICYHGRPSIPESVTETTQCRTAYRSWTVGPQPWVLEHWHD